MPLVRLVVPVEPKAKAHVLQADWFVLALSLATAALMERWPIVHTLRLHPRLIARLPALAPLRWSSRRPSTQESRS